MGKLRRPRSIAGAALGPRSLCPEPGCPELTDGGRCERHKKTRERRRGSSAKRGYGAAHRAMRKRVLREEPICRICRRRPSSIADHIVPREAGGSDERENYQGACKPCHDAKTRREDGGGGRVRNLRVTLVCGPPASGKSSFVRQRMRPGDLILDVDALFEALSGQPVFEKPAAILPFVLAARDAALDRLASQPRGVAHAWVIACAPHPRERERLAERFNAHVLVMETSAEECLRRIQADPLRASTAQRWAPLVRDWWHEYRRREGERVVESIAGRAA